MFCALSRGGLGIKFCAIWLIGFQRLAILRQAVYCQKNCWFCRVRPNIDRFVAMPIMNRNAVTSPCPSKRLLGQNGTRSSILKLLCGSANLAANLSLNVSLSLTTMPILSCVRILASRRDRRTLLRCDGQLFQRALRRTLRPLWYAIKLGCVYQLPSRWRRLPFDG